MHDGRGVYDQHLRERLRRYAKGIMNADFDTARCQVLHLVLD